MDEAVNVRCYVLPFIDYGLGYFDDATSGIGLTVAHTVLGRFSKYASRPIARIGCCALCLSTIKSGHIGGAARRELGGKESAQPVRRRARTAHLSPRRDACACHCNISCMTAAGDGGGTRRARQRGQGIPVGSNRSAVRRIRFAMGNAAMSADRECPLIESVG